MNQDWRNFPMLCGEDLDRLPLLELGAFIALADPTDPYSNIICRNPLLDGIERLGSFREFLMGHFYFDYRNYLKELLEDGKLAVGKSGARISKPEYIGVNDSEIIRIDLYRKSGFEVYADIILKADITFYDHFENHLITDKVTQWFRLRTISDLSPNCLSFNELVFAAVYEREELPPGRALDEYLIPYTPYSFLDGDGMELLSQYYPEALESPCRINGEELAKRMGLTVIYCRLAGNGSIRGQIYFEEREVRLCDRSGNIIDELIPADTIIIDVSSCKGRDGAVRRELLNDTVIHECFHAYQHRLFYLGQRLYNDEIRCLSCSAAGMNAVREIDAGYSMSQSNNIEDAVVGDAVLSSKSPIHWIEWQADRAAPRISMPKLTTEKKIKELYAKQRKLHPKLSSAEMTANVIGELADFFGVSRQSARLRMTELGYEEAQGVLNYANGRYVENHSYAPGTLGKDQTFTIDFRQAIELYSRDELFRERISSGCYQYADGHYSLADKKYLYTRNGELRLTAYAKSHMYECCLIFTIRKGRNGYTYGEGTLQKEQLADGSRVEYDQFQPAEFDFKSEAKRLSDILYSLPASPNETLKKHMELRKITVEGLVAKSGVSESTIHRMRSSPSYRTSRNNVLAICIGLKLEPPLQKDWLRKCGVQFTDSPEDMMYELMLCSLYRQPLSEFNKKLAEYGYPPLSRCVDELDR